MLDATRLIVGLLLAGFLGMLFAMETQCMLDAEEQYAMEYQDNELN